MMIWRFRSKTPSSTSSCPFHHRRGTASQLLANFTDVDVVYPTDPMTVFVTDSWNVIGGGIPPRRPTMTPVSRPEGSSGPQESLLEDLQHPLFRLGRSERRRHVAGPARSPGEVNKACGQIGVHAGPEQRRLGHVADHAPRTAVSGAGEGGWLR